jgi:branched-subunit amino acid aminotransferase/4-amino-4-deoxychorismate lyase
MGIEDRVLWIDGRQVPAAEATVSVLSHSMQRGSLVFDVYTVVDVGGRPHGLAAREHTERFLRSAREMGLQVPYGVDALLEVAAELVAANAGCDTVRLSAYFAEPTFDLLPAVDRATVAVAAYAWGDLHPSSRGGEPARLALPGTRKVPNDVLPVQAKAAASYAHAALAKAAARAAGFHDVLLLDGQHGGIGESGTMSFFLVVHGAIHVPGLAPVGWPAVLRLVLPKGSLEKATLELFDAADLTVVRSSSVDYKASVNDPRIGEVRILRPQEIPTYVAEGLFDLGITGRDWVEETAADVVSLGELRYSKATGNPIRVVVAVAAGLTRWTRSRTCPRASGCPPSTPSSPAASSSRRGSRPTSACPTAPPRPRSPTSPTASSTSPRPAGRCGPPG